MRKSRVKSSSSAPGINGLAATKTYLEINPTIELTILDKDGSVGGVWSLSRVYAGLGADFPAPVYEFSDLRMIPILGFQSGQIL